MKRLLLTGILLGSAAQVAAITQELQQALQKNIGYALNDSLSSLDAANYLKTNAVAIYNPATVGIYPKASRTYLGGETISYTQKYGDDKLSRLFYDVSQIIDGLAGETSNAYPFLVKFYNIRPTTTTHTFYQPLLQDLQSVLSNWSTPDYEVEQARCGIIINREDIQARQENNERLIAEFRRTYRLDDLASQTPEGSTLNISEQGFNAFIGRNRHAAGRYPIK